ncbi:MAG: diguanylate cyclase [Sterolibacterium sp.]|jgi:diguanylate cyclase (GGDEF)-like protein
MFKLKDRQAVLQQLTQAIYNHEQWHRELIRTVSCRLPIDRRDAVEDAHRKCRFGQWYYSVVDQVLRDHPAFAALEVQHERVHRFAAQLLHSSENGPSASPSDYDNFANALDRLRLEIYTLKGEIEDSLHSLDPLTGAENRIAMLTKLREALALVKRHVGPHCVAMMDIDHFKKINDTYGHIVGDRVLASSASYVMEHLRPYDKIFRYGGEEFLLSMPGLDLQAAQVAIERIRSGLVATELASDSGKPVFATASFGIAQLDPDVGIEESIDRADMAMYAAKTGGRNRVCAWDSSMGRNSAQ